MNLNVTRKRSESVMGRGGNKLESWAFSNPLSDEHVQECEERIKRCKA